MKPGIYYDMPRADYNAIPAVSQSVLKQFKRSPAHARHYMTHGIEQTPEMAFGTLLHTAILEPKKFQRDYVVMPDLTVGLTDKDGNPYKNPRNTTAYRAAVSKFGQENIGKKFVEAEDKAKCQAIAEAIAAHSTASELLCEIGSTEVAVVWEDDVTGLLCKALLDGLNEEVLRLIVDVKTTDNAMPWAFASTAHNYGYHNQDAFYLWGMSRIDMAANAFLHVVIEREAPHGVAVYELDDESIALGLSQNREWLNQYAECKRTGHYPGYPEGIQPLRLPRYAF